MDFRNHILKVTNADGSMDGGDKTGVASYAKPFTAEKILIACGTRPARRPDFHFDGTHIIDR